ncbi:MAG: hypothetical protein GTO63_31395, partial [Anaerolineae bacterium]|nr:hypothetical protein [Anaerolineae bacterium]NIN99197.1 hypothetical protein [Anaerolineae bacterium]NIQ82038.1 hypothetical protein [Anaerolineae bacterium]
MNNALWGMGSDFPTYLLVGDPDSRNCQPDAGRYTVESEVRGNGSLWLRFRNVEAELIEVQLSDPDLCRRIRRTGCRLELEREAQQPLTFLIAAEPGDITLRLLVFGYGRLHHSSLTMTLHSGGLLTPAECARLGRLARNLGQAPWFGVSLDDNVKELEAAMQRLARTERVLRGQVGHASSSTLARSLKAQARDAQARLLARLLREATQRPFWLPHEYAVAFQGQNLNDSTGDCPLCGERVYEKILAHPFETESIRHIGQCPRCGLVYDRPQGHGLLVFGGPEAAEAGQDVIQELWLANPDQEPAVGLAGLAVGMSSVHDVKVSPDMLPYEI